MKLRATDQRMGERRRHPGRRDEDPAKIIEPTWQEACGHDRKVIQLIQEGYERFTKMVLLALVVLAVFVGIALWRDFVLTSQNGQRIKDIHSSRVENATQQCRDQRSAHRDLVKFLQTITPAKQKAANPNFNVQVEGFAQAIDPARKNCLKYAESITR